MPLIEETGSVEQIEVRQIQKEVQEAACDPIDFPVFTSSTQTPFTSKMAIETQTIKKSNREIETQTEVEEEKESQFEKPEVLSDWQES